MSSLIVSEREVRDVAILDLDGQVTIGETNRQLHKAIHRMIAEGKLRIILNLANVTYIDSTGLGEIVAGFTTLSTAGGTLKIINLPTRVKDLMTITKLYTVFDIYETEDAGVDSFEADEEAKKITRPIDTRSAEKAVGNVTYFKRRAGNLL